MQKGYQENPAHFVLNLAHFDMKKHKAKV